MKRIYSIILFFSFLVGTLQPVLPMIEYQLYQGDVMELLGHSQDDAGKLNSIVTISSADEAPTHSSGHDKTLLNDNFYPLGITTETMPRMIVFPHTNRLYQPQAGNIASHVFLPNPPPPRLS